MKLISSDTTSSRYKNRRIRTDRRALVATMLKILIFLGAMIAPSLSTVYPRVLCTPGTDSIYNYNATLLDGSATVTFDEYAGKVILVYNVATYWGLTVGSYNQANALLDMFPEDFVVLGFPSNIFGKQEPGAGYNEITNGITYVRPGGGFVTNMTLFEKIDVNGVNEVPLYQFLKGSCPYVDDTYRVDAYYSPYVVGDVHWNFEKFLLGKDGKVFTRYHPSLTNVTDVSGDIQYLLGL